MAYRILILIDHKSHNETNSLYPLARAFSHHHRVNQVFVASRSDPANQAFFQDPNSLRLLATQVDQEFHFDPTGRQFDRTGSKENLHDFDLVILRLPHPVSEDFLRCLSLEVKPGSIINRPEGLIITGSKKFLLELRDLCPPLRWCRSFEDVNEFHQKFNLVLKPLRNYGGKGIIRIYEGKLEGQDGYVSNLSEARTYLKELNGDGYLAMKYLENVHLGDKRIVIVNGKIIGATLRKPPSGSWICNVSQGGIAVTADVDEREKVIIEEVNRKVRPLGIGIFGVDTLVDDSGARVLSELNTISVGGFGPMEMQQQRPIAKVVADELINYYEHTNT